MFLCSVFSCFLFFLFSWTIFHERSRMEGNYARKYEKLYAQSCVYLALFWSKCYTISDIWSTRLEVYDKGIHDIEKVAYLSGIMFVSKIFEDISWNNIFNIYFYIRLRTAANGERRIGYVDIRNIDLTKSLSGRRAERSRFSLLEY